MYIVIDTNVFVSAFWSPISKPAFILSKVFSKEITLCYSLDIYREYSDVLKRKKFSFNRNDVQNLLTFIFDYGIWLEPKRISDINFVDESDKKFYEAAKFFNAILITGNKKHYPEDPCVLTPSEFIEKYC